MSDNGRESTSIYQAGAIGYVVARIDSILERLTGDAPIVMTERDAQYVVVALKRWKVSVQFGDEPMQFVLDNSFVTVPGDVTTES